MKRNDLFVNTVFFVALFILSTSINIYYGNLGVFPIDTFAFFDTAYSILLNKHPFKDIWITTGPFVDYAQAFFFKIFGLSWFSYLIHASFFNFLITITIFYFKKTWFRYHIFFFILIICCNTLLSCCRNTICLSAFIYSFCYFFNVTVHFY